MYPLIPFSTGNMFSSKCLPRFCTLLAVFTIALAAPALSSDLAPLEKLAEIPQGWERGRNVGAAQMLRFRIAIKQENAFRFEQHLLAISDPDHPKYGHHMKRDELKAMLRPSEDASSAVKDWLQSQGVPRTHIQDEGDWINIFVSTTEAERILDTKFHYYHNKVVDIERIRTLQYSVPRNLHQYIHMIQPTTRFGQFKPQRSTVYEHFEIGPAIENLRQYSSASLNATFCNTTITPQCLRDLYHIGDARGNADNGKSSDSRPLSTVLSIRRGTHRGRWVP